MEETGKVLWRQHARATAAMRIDRCDSGYESAGVSGGPGRRRTYIEGRMTGSNATHRTGNPATKYTNTGCACSAARPGPGTVRSLVRDSRDNKGIDPRDKRLLEGCRWGQAAPSLLIYIQHTVEVAHLGMARSLFRSTGYD